jgi:hypothetical protein
LGYSHIIIDSLNNKGKLKVLALDCWKEKIRDLIKNFREISFEHIFQESNMEADQLSNASLQKKEGLISYNKWVEGAMGQTM